MWNSSTKAGLFLLIFSICFLHNEQGICAKNTLPKKVVIDSTKVDVRKPSEEIQKEILNNSDYKYDRIGPAPKTMWERFKEWFWRKVGDLFDSDGGSLGFKIFEWVLLAGAIVLIVFLLLKNDVRNLFYGKSASVPIDFSEFEEDIHKINFEELIAEALSKKDFRKAIRLHFLKLLKELSDSNLILWRMDKTNNDYSIELLNSKYDSKFKELAHLYEYVWYGDFPLDENNFKNTVSKFKEFTLH